MKKQIILSAISSLVLLFTACQSEDENPKLSENGKGKITFALPAPSGTVSYATVTASADENLLNKLDIYMFNEGEVLEYVYDAVTANGSGASRTATIDVTGRAGEKSFYFVANAEGQSAELDNVVVGTTTLSEFKEVLTNKQSALIAASDGLLMSATKTITDITADLSVADKTVNLRRRVARFDVLNDASVTNFEISKIMVSKANLRTYLFEDATATPPKVIEADKLPVVDFNTSNFADANTATVVASVFYIYPTSLEEGKTEISIEGLFNGVTKAYTVSLPASTPIKANYRYVLKAKKMDITNIEWELAIDEWEDGSEVESGPGNSLFTFSDLTFSGGTGGIFDAATKTYDMTAATTAAVIRFKTSSINKQGTIAKVVYKYDTDGSSFPGFTVVTPEPILTYGASYIQDYKIDIPVQTEKLPIRVEITVWDAVSPVRKEVIVIQSLPKYDITAYTPVLVGGKYWAPVNVGATEIDATIPSTASNGYLYQWGRNVPFTYGVTYETQTGPVSYADAIEGGQYANKFIAGVIAPTYDWVTPLNDNLWSGTKAQGPCPNGWKIPSGSELSTLIESTSPDRFSTIENRLPVVGDEEGKILYLTTTGFIQMVGNGSSSITGRIIYWSTTPNYIYNATSETLDFGLTSSSLLMRLYPRSYGFGIRCIQAD